MKKNNIIYILLLLYFLISTSNGFVVVAQNNHQSPEETLETRTFDEAVWQKLNEDLDYSGQAPEPKEVKEKEEKSNFEFPTLPPVLQLILITLMIALLAWLIYSIVRKNDADRFIVIETVTDDRTEKLSLKHIEEKLDKSDVYPLLFQAEQDENYHLAVRLQFLALLKKLHTNGNIRWKKDLTNRAYLRQMQAQGNFSAFKDLTRTFERVWYGHQIPDKTAYEEIKTAFYAFKPTSTSVNPSANE